MPEIGTLRRWQREAELDLGGAGARELRSAAVGFGDRAHDGEAEARASAGGAGRDEAAEQLRLHVLGDRAGAHDAYGDARAFAAHDDARSAARVTVHDRVVDEVVDGAREPCRLAPDERVVGERELDDRAAILRRLARR